MKNKKTFTYKQAGVDVKAGNRFVDYIQEIIAGYPTSKDRYVIGGIGGFVGCFNLGSFLEEYKQAKHQMLMKTSQKKK